MREISREQILDRIRSENPWWREPGTVHPTYDRFAPRAYLKPFYDLLTASEVRRALVLLGPRRVGKTVLIHHAIHRLISDEEVPPTRIAYFSIDHPLFNDLGLEQMLEAFLELTDTSLREAPAYVFFDEIQYLPDWEVHLKSLVDRYPSLKIVASGSAAAALRMKSRESGAGRFTDFLLPPLTFYEYLHLLDRDHLVGNQDGTEIPVARDIARLNEEFIQYLNYGGYPEAVFSQEIQRDPARFIKSDIIDKVLLRDLPSLYGIGDIQELNRLFTTLAFNTAGEVSLEGLSQSSRVAKNTIKKYVEYLEAAFLIRSVHRIDRSARRFQRVTAYKAYLTNPSMRAALFSPVDPASEWIGAVVETAVFAQWFHADEPLHYARWDGGEVDLVRLDANQRPELAIEVKWSDRYYEHPAELGSLLTFCRENGLQEAFVTTITKQGDQIQEGISLSFIPASIYTYEIGRRLIRGPAG